MRAYQKSFLQFISITALACFCVVAIALIGTWVGTPIAVLCCVFLSLYLLRIVRALGWLTVQDDSRILSVLSLILLVIGGINSADLLWLFSGMIVFYIALARQPAEPKPLPNPINWQSPAYPIRKTPLIIGALMMGFVAETSGQLLNLSALKQVPTTVQFSALIIAILLIIWGMIGDIKLTPRSWAWREIALVGFIALIAFSVRIYQLGEAQRFVIDEILFIKPIINIWDHPNIPLFIPFSPIASFPLIYPYLQSWSVELFGASLAGIRFVSVIFGGFGMIALYLFARALFGRRIATISAFFLATMPIHIQFSRIGINNIADPLFGTLALYCIAQAFSPDNPPTRTMRYLGLVGVCTGLTQYWYDGGRFIFLGLALLWLITLVIKQMIVQKAMLPTTFKGCLLFLVGFALIASPVYYTLYAQSKPLSSRFESVGIYSDDLQPNPLATHTQTGLTLIYNFHFSQPEIDFYFAGDDPIMPRHAVPFFIGGLLLAIRWIFKRQVIGLLVIYWLALTWIGNLLLETPNISARYITELPLIALLVALGIDGFSRLIFRQKRLAVGVTVAVTLSFGAVQVYNYFGDYMERFNNQFRHEQAGRNRDIDDMLFRAVDFSSTTQVYVLDDAPFPSSDLDNLLRFYRGVKSNWRYTVYVLSPADALQTPTLERLNREREHAFFVPIVSPNGMDTLLMDLFNDEISGPFYTDYVPSMASQYMLYILPAQN